MIKTLVADDGDVSDGDAWSGGGGGACDGSDDDGISSPRGAAATASCTEVRYTVPVASPDITNHGPSETLSTSFPSLSLSTFTCVLPFEWASLAIAKAVMVDPLCISKHTTRLTRIKGEGMGADAGADTGTDAGAGAGIGSSTGLRIDHILTTPREHPVAKPSHVLLLLLLLLPWNR